MTGQTIDSLDEARRHAKHAMRVGDVNQTTEAAERLRLTDPDTAVVERHVARYQRAIRMTDRPGGWWMDAACGTGYGAFLMTMVADNVYGIDLDDDAIEYARAHYRAPGLSFQRMDLSSEDFMVLGFDVIVSVETFEHLTQQAQARWIQKVARGVRERCGVFVMTCPIGNGPNPLNPHHLHEPTNAELQRLLRRWFADVDLVSERVTMTTGEEQEQIYARCWNPR